MIKEQIEKDEQSKNYDKWSDLERALGEYVQEICEESYEDFKRDKMKLDSILVEYIRQEREEVVFDDINLGQFVIKKLHEALTWEKLDNKKLIEQCIEESRGKFICYRAINFNYTNCFEHFFELAKDNQPENIYRLANGETYKEYIEEVLHIHGTLDDGEMILGVNDETQIKNIKLLELTDVRELLIKSNLNVGLEQGKIERAKEIIDTSDIICLYGLSLGDTDKMWWEYIMEWLEKSYCRVLIIFVYDSEYKGDHIYLSNSYKKNVKEKFLKQAGGQYYSTNKKEMLKRQMIIGINKNIFKIDLRAANRCNTVLEI